MLTRLTSILLLGAAAASAQSVPRPLSVDDAIRLAWANDRSVLPLSLERETASAREIQAAIRPAPELDVKGSTRLGDANEWGIGVGISQQLPRRERVELARALARVEGESAPLLIREQRRQIAGQARLRYYGWVVRAAQRDAAVRQANFVSEMFGSLERRVAAGEVASAELEFMRLEQVRAEQARALSEAALAAAEQQLRARLRIPADQVLPPETSLEDVLQRPLPSVEAFDERNRPEIALAAHAVARADAATGLARAAGRPDLKVGAGLDFARRANDATGRLENEPTLSVGVSVPLPGQPRNRGDVLERQAEFRVADARLVAVRENIVAEVGGAIAAVRALAPVLATLQAAVRAQVMPSSLSGAISRGEVSVLQLIQYRQLQLAMETEFISAAAHYAELLAEAETALGLLPEES